MFHYCSNLIAFGSFDGTAMHIAQAINHWSLLSKTAFHNRKNHFAEVLRGPLNGGHPEFTPSKSGAVVDETLRSSTCPPDNYDNNKSTGRVVERVEYKRGGSTNKGR